MIKYYEFLYPIICGIIIGILFSINIFIGFILFCFVMYRNWWVYKQRFNIIHTNIDEYDDYDDFDTMMIKFWIWDVEKFKKTHFKQL